MNFRTIRRRGGRAGLLAALLAGAAAAYDSGSNDGRDGFGRHPSNPAGIDLADGVFHDLGLTDNGNVR